MKLGAITNGISMDFETALQTMKQDGIGYAELQFIWDTEICHHTDAQNQRMKELLEQYGIKVACIMKHVLNGLPVTSTDIDSDVYQEQLRLLRKSIELARFFGTTITRIQPFSKQNVIFGYGGADKYLTGYNRTWKEFLKKLEPCCQIAEDERIDMMMETGTGSFVHTVSIAKRVIDEMRCSRLKILWDPANCLYSMENPIRAYEIGREHIIDVHIKDIRVNKPMAEITYCPLGYGEMAQYTQTIADLLRQDKYDGVVTYENQVIPDGKSEREGWALSVKMFREIFGDS